MLERLARVLLLTGVRLSEATSLKWHQIDLERSQMEVHGKGNKLRTVPLSEEVLPVLRSCPRHINSKYVFWHDMDGKPYKQASTILASIKRRIDVAFRTHDLRHRFAVGYLANGGNIYRLQKS